MPVNLPQLQVTIGNTPIYGAVALEIEQVAYLSAGTFTLSLACGASPLMELAFYASLGKQTITISAAAGLAGYASLMTGQIDNIGFNLPANIVTLSGRDLSARLIDTEISETFANQTSSQIATTIAGRHELTANVTTTATPVGQYYELDHARSALSLHTRTGSEWNMLSYLADNENYLLSVNGTTLNFGPPSSGSPTPLTPEDCVELLFDTSTAIPEGVTVRSWNTKQKQAISQNAGGMAGNTATLVRPNLTNEQAINLANNHLATLAQHQTILVATLPGETNLLPASRILLSGTNSSFDQTYMIDSITRYIYARQGFIETVRAHVVTNSL